LPVGATELAAWLLDETTLDELTPDELIVDERATELLLKELDDDATEATELAAPTIP
jgi:hypothetical protein